MGPAYFVVARRQNARRLPPPQHGGARSGFDCLRSAQARIALWDPPTSSSLADKRRAGSLLLSTAARDPGSIAFAPLRRGSRCRTRLLRRRSPTKRAPAPSSSAQRRAIRVRLPSLRSGADRAVGPAYFVVARRQNARRLPPPQHSGARSGFDCLRSAQARMWGAHFLVVAVSALSTRSGFSS